MKIHRIPNQWKICCLSSTEEESVPQGDGDVDLPDSSCDENSDDEVDVI